MAVFYNNVFDVCGHVYNACQYLFKPNGTGLLYSTCIPAEYATEFKLFPFGNQPTVQIPELSVDHVLRILSSGKGGAVEHLQAALACRADQTEYETDYNTLSTMELYTKYGFPKFMDQTFAVVRSKMAEYLRIPLSPVNHRTVNTTVIDVDGKSVFIAHIDDNADSVAITDKQMEDFVDLANQRANCGFDIGRGLFLEDNTSMLSIINHPLFKTAMSVYPTGCAVKVYLETDERVYLSI